MWDCRLGRLLRLRALLDWLVEVIEEASGTMGETQTEKQLCSDLLIYYSDADSEFFELLTLTVLPYSSLL
jgi:hypothetical protein